MVDSKIAVSVIVLTYNHKPYIRQALDSILEQKTDFSYEILVGDDASTDGTSEIVREYAQRFPKIIRAFVREKNLGATRNLYDLFERARGTYIANCEGDDYWCDLNKLQHQVDFLNSHLDYSACTHACRIVDENNIAAKNQTLPWICTKTHYTLKDFRGVYLPGQSATLVHRNFFLNKQHDYAIIYRANPMIADRTVVLILAAMGAIRCFPEVMSCYRVRTLGVAQNATSTQFRNNPDVNRMQVEYTRKLEQYMKKEFGIKIDTFLFKSEQLIKNRIKRIWNRLR